MKFQDMEDKINNIIHSFLTDYDKKKLDFLDKILFRMLLQKEIFLLRNKKCKMTKKIEEILSRYADYRRLIIEKINGMARMDLKEKVLLSPGRLILLVTHRCQLRCCYCRVSKFDKSMCENIIFDGVDLLFTARRKDIQLQFFGGEPLLEFNLMKKAVYYAEEKNKILKKDLHFILTTNGIALSQDKIDFLQKHNFTVECSFDGEIENQLKMRFSPKGISYYDLVLKNFKKLFETEIKHYSISVFTPENIKKMYDNFRYLVSIGFKNLQINYSLGQYWPRESIDALFDETRKVFDFIAKREKINFINLTVARREPVVLNAELTLDCDGKMYLESGICLEEDFFSMKKKFLIKPQEGKGIDSYCSTRFQNFYRLTKAYSDTNENFRKIILNNIFLGHKYRIFINDLKSRF